MAWLLRAAGGADTIMPENGERFSLEEIRRLVGADTFEMLRLGATQVMFTTPLDHPRGLRNDLATHIAANLVPDNLFISGDALLCRVAEAPVGS